MLPSRRKETIEIINVWICHNYTSVGYLSQKLMVLFHFWISENCLVMSIALFAKLTTTPPGFLCQTLMIACDILQNKCWKLILWNLIIRAPRQTRAHQWQCNDPCMIIPNVLCESIGKYGQFMSQHKVYLVTNTASYCKVQLMYLTCIIDINILRTWWRHLIETFSALLALCEGNPPVTVGFP